MIRYNVQSDWEVFISNFTDDYTAGIPLYDLKQLGEFNCGQGYFTEGDELRGCLIFYTIDGEGELTYNGKTVALPKHTIAIISCSKHFLYRTKDAHWHFTYIHYLGSTAHAIIKAINEDDIFTGILGPEDFFHEFNVIRYHMKHARRNTSLEISLRLYTIMAKIMALKVSGESTEYKKYERTINEVCEHIAHNLNQKITIDDLAGLANLSKFHFIRVFQNITGYTPHKYILLLRINKAKSLLNNEDLSISQIAEMCDFGDSKNFILNFRKFTGTTPKKYRKENIFLG
jgi:AraC-like DNA-binding protein